MSKESEKKPLSSRDRCSLFQVKAWLSRPKKMVVSDSSEVTQEALKTPSRARWPRMHLIKVII